MKAFIFIFSFFLANLVSRAQPSATSEAKAAYLLAEEAFSASDWKSTLDYLQQCKKLMGKANSKILYLQIMTEAEIARKDPEYYEAILTSIAAFEKAPDVKQFNEDKVLEVMKLKLITVRKKEEIAIAKLAEEKEREALLEKEKRLKALGGVVVYESGGHGLIVASQDLGKLSWKKAKEACDSLVLNGHDDWYLPTRDELKQIYNTLHQTNRIRLETSDNYWTSEEAFGVLAWSISFINGKQSNWAKNLKYYVRPVRKF